MSGKADELIMVFAVVSAVVVLGIRSIYRSIKGDKTGKCCGCASCKCEDANEQGSEKSFLNIYEKEA